MLDVLELEKRWSSYHFKKMLPRYIIMGTVLITSAIGSYIFVLPIGLSQGASTVQSIEKSTSNKSLNNTDVAKTVTVKPHPISPDVTVYTSQNILTPSFTFLTEMDKKLVIYNNALILASVSHAEKPKYKKVVRTKKKKPPKRRVKKVVKKKTTPKKKVVPVKKNIPPVKVTKKKSEPTKSIILGKSHPSKIKKESNHAILQKKKTTDSELASVIKRFKRSKKPALGLFIANKYYVNGNYRESYKYAKATYKINPNIEDAVLLYAKSLAKLGHKDKAIARLKPYIKKSGSIEAKALLNNLNKGLFK